MLSRRAAAPRLPPEAMITKLYWATWHRELGKLAMDVLGPEAEIGEALPYELDAAPAPVPVHALRHDLRRLERDPAQPDRRARARPAAGAASRA